jgi:hypothetical protein
MDILACHHSGEELDTAAILPIGWKNVHRLIVVKNFLGSIVGHEVESGAVGK